MDFSTIVFAFAIGAIVFGLMLLLVSLVERTAPEEGEAIRSVSGSARQSTNGTSPSPGPLLKPR